MSVYGTVSDAMIVIFTMDEEILSKTGAANIKAPAPLREFIEDVNK